jgi:hypothetical protein
VAVQPKFVIRYSNYLMTGRVMWPEPKLKIRKNIVLVNMSQFANQNHTLKYFAYCAQKAYSFLNYLADFFDVFVGNSLYPVRTSFSMLISPRLNLANHFSTVDFPGAESV